MNQKGIAQLAILFFLLASIGIGTYIVQNRTNIFPHAQESCTENCGSDDLALSLEPDKPKDEENKAQGNGCGEGTIPVDGGCKDIRINDGGSSKSSGGNNNTSGNPGGDTSTGQVTTSDGQSLDTQDKTTRDRFRDTYCPAGSTEICNTAKQQWANEHSKVIITVKSDKVTTSDGQSLNTQSLQTQKDFRAAYCPAGATENCEAAKQQWAEDHVVNVANSGMQTRIDKFKNEGKNELDKARQYYKDKYNIDYDAKNESASYADCIKKLNADFKQCNEIITNLRNISQAQDEFDKLATLDCSKETDQAKCQVLKQASLDNAKIKYRTAMCDAVESSVKGANCVLDVGDTQNVIKVDIVGRETRVLVGCSTNASKQNDKGECQKILNYRGEDGAIHALPNNALIKLQESYCKSDQDKQISFCQDPTKPIYSLSDLPSGLRGGLNGSCTAIEKGCIAAGNLSAQSTDPAKQASDAGNKSVTAETCKSFKSNSGGGSSCKLTKDKADASFVCQLSDSRYNTNGNSFIQGTKNFLGNKVDISGCEDDQIVKYWCENVGQDDCARKKKECKESGVCTNPTGSNQSIPVTQQISKPACTSTQSCGAEECCVNSVCQAATPHKDKPKFCPSG